MIQTANRCRILNLKGWFSLDLPKRETPSNTELLGVREYNRTLIESTLLSATIKYLKQLHMVTDDHRVKNKHLELIWTDVFCKNFTSPPDVYLN